MHDRKKYLSALIWLPCSLLIDFVQIVLYKDSILFLSLSLNVFFIFLLFVQAASDLNNDDVLCELEEFCRNDDALHLQERLGSFSNGIWKPNIDLQAQYPWGVYKYYEFLVSLLRVATLLF